MPGSQHSGYAGHPWHHYLAGGPGSLWGLVLPLLVIAFLALLLAAGRRAANRAQAVLASHKARAASPRALDAAPPTLASDLERDEATSLVSMAVGEGRLGIEEGVQRIDALLRSRHRHEIARLVADLPIGTSATRNRPLGTQLRPVSLGFAAAVILAAVLVQALVGLWELWPVALVALGGVALLPHPSTRVLPAG
ncbi:MAG: DUF1707 domain-containing protein [Acidimicrobiales bacterium]